MFLFYRMYLYLGDNLKTRNVNLKMKLLECQKFKQGIESRTEANKNTYANECNEHNKRIESLAAFKKIKEVSGITEILKHKLREQNVFENQLKEHINMKKQKNLETDNAQIIELAKFMVYSQQELLSSIEKKKIAIKELKSQIDKQQKEFAVRKMTRSIFEDKSCFSSLKLTTEVKYAISLYIHY